MDTSCLLFLAFPALIGLAFAFLLRSVIRKRRARSQRLKLARKLRDAFSLQLSEGDTEHTLRDDLLTVQLRPCSFTLRAAWPASSPFWDDSILIKATTPEQQAAVWKDIRLGLAAHTQDPDFDTLYTVYAHDPSSAAADLPIALRRALCTHHHEGTHVDFEGISITLRPKRCGAGFSFEECSTAIQAARALMVDLEKLRTQHT